MHMFRNLYQNNIQWHISLGLVATAFQGEVAAILDCVTSCLRKRLMKEHITICTDTPTAVITACGGLYRKADSTVRVKPGNHNVDTWALRNSAE